MGLVGFSFSVNLDGLQFPWCSLGCPPEWLLMWVIPRAAMVFTDALLIDALLWMVVTLLEMEKYFNICSNILGFAFTCTLISWFVWGIRVVRG